ncbi:MAG TPA: MFS transporter, partial [Verrucomicrobiae bacterium]|nr:MFS transporter [Verrucomicrobiae bacterium]
FGTLISMGIYFAFDWGQAIVNVTKVQQGQTSRWLHDFARKIFASDATPVDAVWAVFFIPAVILLFWLALDAWLIKDTPEEADFPHLDTHDASSGAMHIELTTWDLLKKVFASPLMLLFAGISFTSGVLRNGITQWYFLFAKQVPQGSAKLIGDHWGLLLCIFGIIGGFAGGLISDRFFQSRRAPPVVLLSAMAFLLALAMSASLNSSPWMLGCAGVGIVMAAIGVTSLMSGTAAADFGGRKATATCSGIIDGFAYLGTGLQSFGIGMLVDRGNWHWWPIFLMPFALLGAVLAMSVWHKLPDATRRYIATVEQKPAQKPGSGTLAKTPAESE